MTLISRRLRNVLIRLHTEHLICKLCLKMQNNEFILPWENVRHLIGILETITKEKQDAKKKNEEIKEPCSVCH